MLPQIPNLRDAVWNFVAQIPFGAISTYGDIARALGDVAASRFVGGMMLRHDHGADCCCHRVVRADGSLGKFVSGEVRQKADILRSEGHVVDNGYRIVIVERWISFLGDPCLKPLAVYQKSVADNVRVDQPLEATADCIVAGVDVSFVPKTNLAVAAYVEVSRNRREPVYVKTCPAEIPFPYVSGYLAYRELPLLLELLGQVRKDRSLAQVIVVDGSGVLHPRRAGVASMLGVTANVPTIGVTKKHLTGNVDLAGLTANTVREIYLENELAGFAMLPGSGTSKPIYVSPGHMCDAVSSLAVIQYCRQGRRLPEPIYWADRLSRDAAKAMR